MNASLCLRFSLVIGMTLFSGCNRPVPRSTEVAAIAVATIPGDPADPAWDVLPEFAARLLPQDIVEPRLMNASTAEVQVRAAVSSSEIAFRLQWTDAVANDTPGPSRFIDACVIQMPEDLAGEPPDPQMGAAGKRVQIAYWRADWQASVDGRADDIHALYPNAAIDHYPFDAPTLEAGSGEQREFAKRYAPAEASGNRRAGVRQNPVEDLLAEGPGELSPAGSAVSHGKGVYGNQTWAVVIVRPRPPGLAPPARGQVAFAVWDGAQGEVGSRKMRTGWVPLSVRGQQ